MKIIPIIELVDQALSFALGFRQKIEKILRAFHFAQRVHSLKQDAARPCVFVGLIERCAAI